MGAAETALKELVGMSVLRCDAAGGGEGAGLREDGRGPGVYGEGVRGRAIPKPGAVEEPDRGLVWR